MLSSVSDGFNIDADIALVFFALDSELVFSKLDEIRSIVNHQDYFAVCVTLFDYLQRDLNKFLVKRPDQLTHLLNYAYRLY